MGVFLRFGEGSRLVQVRGVESGNYGTTPPIDWFPDAMPGDFAMEMHPECLKTLRPAVLSELNRHCVYQRNEEGHTLVVDSHEVIGKRMAIHAKRDADHAILNLAQTVAHIRGARQVLEDEKCPEPSDAANAEAQCLENLRAAASRRKSIGEQVPVPESLAVLGALAGKVVPIL